MINSGPNRGAEITERHGRCGVNQLTAVVHGPGRLIAPGRYGLLSRRRKMSAGHLARANRGDASRPTRRRHAMVSASESAIAVTLHATATPRRPYAGPTITNRRNRTPSPTAMMAG